jgi:ketosteroid isomerase-like protein
VRSFAIRLAVVVPLLLIACTPGTRQREASKSVTTPDTAAIRESARARVAAIAAGDIERYLAAYEDEAVWVPPLAEEIVGKAAARQRLEGVFEEAKVETVSTTDEQVIMSPDWILDRGTFASTRTPKDSRGEPDQAVGSYLTIWHRQQDGSFKIAYDIWNSDRPLEPESE